MIALTEAEDTFELFLRDLQAQGREVDFPLLREANREILGIPTGDDTPLPGALIVEPTLVLPPAVHEGLNEPPEGKFWLPPFRRAPGFHYSVGDLQTKLSRTRVWLALLTMYAITATIVAAVNW